MIIKEKYINIKSSMLKYFIFLLNLYNEKNNEIGEGKYKKEDFKINQEELL